MYTLRYPELKLIGSQSIVRIIIFFATKTRLLSNSCYKGENKNILYFANAF